MSNVELFEDLPTADASSPADSTDAPATEAATEPSNESDETKSDQSPVETVAEVPSGAMSITDFAAYMTQTLMKDKFSKGEDLDGSEYVVPQAVYQTVKAQRDRIPHVIVKADDESEGRVYVLKDEATAWWISRRERLATRGTAGPASSRTPEENLTLLSNAVAKSLYAQDRSKMWTERVEQAAKLVDKYKGFLSDTDVSTETVELTIQEATDAYNAEKAEKEAEKKSASKKPAKETVNA